MSDTSIPQTPIRELVYPIAQPALVDIIIDNDLLQEIELAVEPASDGRINIIITRRQPQIPIDDSALLNKNYSRSFRDDMGLPDIAAWSADVTTHVLNCGALLSTDDSESIYEPESIHPHVPDTPRLSVSQLAENLVGIPNLDFDGSLAPGDDYHIGDFPQDHGFQSIEHVMEHYYTAQPSELGLSGSKETVNVSSNKGHGAYAPVGSPLEHCGYFGRCSPPLVSPLATPLSGPLGTPDISPLSSPRLQGLGIPLLDLDIPRYQLEAIEARPSTPLIPCMQPTRRERLADAASMVLLL